MPDRETMGQANNFNDFLPPMKDLVGKTVDEIAAIRGVSRRHAYALLRQLSAAAYATVEVPDTLRAAILEQLYRDGSTDANALTSSVQGRGLHTHINDVTAGVWRVQKLGWVTFREEHSAHGSRLTRIKLTPAGRAKAIELRGNTTRQATERTMGVTLRGHSDSPRQGATHAAGIDGTDFRNHRRWNRGEEPEREHHKPIRATDGMFCSHDGEPWPCPTSVERGFADLQPDTPEIIPTPRPEPRPNQNEKPYRLPPEVVEEARASVALDHDPQMETILEQGPTLDSFPLIGDVIERDARAGRYRAAAKELEDVDPETAVELLEKVKLSPLEEEVVKLARALGW